MTNSGSNGSVGEYDAKTGKTINAALVSGLSSPIGIAVKGEHLFVASYTGNTIGEYDAKTGAVINANFITTGLNNPELLALSGDDLFVANISNANIGK